MELFAQHKRHQSMILPWLDEGYGVVKVDSLQAPKVAWLSFHPLNFIAGDAKSSAALNLVRSFPPNNVLVLPDDEWAHLIEDEWAGRKRHQSRWRLSADRLNIEYIRNLKSHVPEGFELVPIDLDVMTNSDDEFWEDTLLYFGSHEEFLKKGFGYCIKHGERVVSVAYTDFPFADAFEVEVMTRESGSYRRKGLGTIVSAALIEDGLLRGLVPQWDAANEISVRLAKKLGYTNPDPYQVYYWIGV
jgi:GNAT superfamily N-acetyltransferase